MFIPEESGHESDVSLQFDLEAGDFSGGTVCLNNLMYDLTPYYSRGALEFWIKGARGGEIARVALVDDENRDGKKTVVRIPLNNNGGITNEWKKVSIPLAKFGRKGVFWDAMPEGAFTYVYGARTRAKVQPGTQDGQGALCFWGKGAPGVKSIYVGLLDSRPDGTRSILLINKHPLTAAAVTLAVPGLKGHGVIKRLDAANAKTGPGKGETVLLSESLKLTIPAFAAVAISQH